MNGEEKERKGEIERERLCYIIRYHDIKRFINETKSGVF